METQSSKNCLPSDECTKKLDQFFANGLYNSCQATDELVKTIEDSQDEGLARKALFLYQRHYSNLERPWDHVTFMYGLGLMYMHFNAYKLAVRAFREAIYVQPNFPRSRDVHTRLGLIFKAIGRYKLSEKHFSLAINDTRPNSGTSTKQELEFQLAHLYELQGKFKQAKEAYERLLQQNNLPHQLSANIYRQLGCMFFMEAEAQNKNGRKQTMFNSQIPNDKIDAALNYLNTSYRADNDSKTSYYLGRCFTNISRYQDAFNSYRSVIDRDESTADTWCSIGILYHRQKQPVDAQQAYIRSVQFDKQHVIAWRNLGILYEDHELFDDALKCYQHALRFSSTEVDESLQARISLLQKQLADLDSTYDRSKTKTGSDKLLSLEDLWNVESKNNQENSKKDDDPTSKQSSSIKSISDTRPKQIKDTNDVSRHVTDQQTNGIHTSIMSNPTLITSPTKVASSNIFQNCANTDNNHEVDSKKRILSSADPTQTQPAANGQIVMLAGIKQERPTFSQESLESKPGSSKDFNMTQVLTNGTSKDSGISSNSSIYADCALVPSQNTDIKATNQVSADQVIEDCRNHPRPRKIDINLLIDEDRPPIIYPKAPPYPPISRNQLILPAPSIFLETKKDLASKKFQDCCQKSPISLVKNLASVLKLDLELFSTKTITEIDPDQHVEIAAHLSNSSTESLEDRVARNHWICEITRSSSTISRYATYQLASSKDLVYDDTSKRQVQKSIITKESETDSNESASMNAKNVSTQIVQTNPETQQNTSIPVTKVQPNKRLKREPLSKAKLVKSANEIDLSDDRKWRSQIGELNKLPNFIKCVSASNILTHVGTLTPGVNTILMSMHVPGCKIPGSRTPNNFCSVCINVGPGDYEWSAVSAEYSSNLTKLCNRYGTDVDDYNWWPQADDLKKYNIPMYRFLQRPGDLVWINPGTFYWVNATGLCNRIYWNVGPLCAMQYISASESFELNKLLFRKSDVPMIQVTWNIIINIHIIFDEELFYAITGVLRRSLKYCVLVKELVEESKKTIQLADKDEEPGPRIAKFCSLCDCEVFNICFTIPSKQINSPDPDGQSLDLHCVECARRLSPNFDGYYIDQEYDLNYLMKLYDNFIETRARFLSRTRARTEKSDNP